MQDFVKVVARSPDRAALANHDAPIDLPSERGPVRKPDHKVEIVVVRRANNE